jgi:hypothetical protein
LLPAPRPGFKANAKLLPQDPLVPARSNVPRIANEQEYAQRILERICALGPRPTGGQQERRAQALAEQEFAALGLDGTWESFRYTRSLYAVMAAHFGLGVAAHAVRKRAPMIAALTHGLVGMSYYLDSTRQAHWLRAAVPEVRSQNLIVTIPAQTPEPRQRFVFIAHADTAYTGTIFHPAVLRTTQGGRDGRHASYVQRSMELVTDTELLLGVLALARALGMAPRWLRWLEHALVVPSALAFLANLEVVLRGESVVGAADNASGVAALVLLASRLGERAPDDIEYVFVVSGAEESGTGGAQRLAERRALEWCPRMTTVLAVDTVTNGDLRWFREGEQGPIPVPARLLSALESLAETDAFAGLQQHAIPAGATDAMPFLARGYDAVGIGCVDPTIGAPRHYHWRSDRAEHVDFARIVDAVDLIAALVRRLEA